MKQRYERADMIMKTHNLLWNILFSNQKSGVSFAGFSSLENGGGSPTTGRTFAHSSPPGKTPLQNFDLLLPCEQQYSCYNPMKLQFQL